MLEERSECQPPFSASLASERVWDVVVLGAGVAGASFASLAAESGRSVLLLDAKEFPREKVCGGCLNRRAQSHLQERGLLTPLKDAGAIAISSLHVQHAKHSSLWRVPSMLSVRRSTLDQLLVEDAIQRGASYLPATKGMVEASIERQPLRTTHLQDASHAVSKQVVSASDSRDSVAVRSQCVVIATGLSRAGLPRSESWPVNAMEDSRIGVHALVPEDQMPLADDFHAKAKSPNPTLHMLLGSLGYVGVCKTDGNQWDFAAAIDPVQIRTHGGIAACIKLILKENGFAKSDFLDHLHWQSTPSLTRTSTCVAKDGIFLLGDALGYVEPFTGEGMSWAFAGAVSLHKLIGCPMNSIVQAAAEQAWNQWVNTSHRKRQQSSRWVANQSRNLTQAQRVLKACDWLPPLRHLLLRKIMT